MKTIYKPYAERKPDFQYENLLREILKRGRKKKPIHAELKENQGSGHSHCLELTGKTLDFYLENGFPLLTCRDLSKSFFGAMSEVIAFINGARTLEELTRFGCPKIFWERWVTKDKCQIFGLPEGDLGPGSYGENLARFPSYGSAWNGKTFNQIDALINNMRKAPHLRTHCLTTWNPAYSMGDVEQGFRREVVVAPCHGNFITFTLFDDQEMEMTTVCRSSDVPVGLPLNIAEWTGFGLMVAYLMNYKLIKSTFFLANPQIYDIQDEAISEILQRSAVAFPTVTIKPNPDRQIERLQDFRKEDFVLSHYYAHPKLLVPSAI